VNAHRINHGVMPDLRKPEAESDFYFVEADDPETAVPRIIELVKTRIPRRFGLDPIRDVQVLCPMNRGGVGARSLNIELQAALNPAGERKVERFGWTFGSGDKVMQIENDYDKEVYNGDIGFVTDVEPEEGELTASFDGRYTAVTRGKRLVVLVGQKKAVAIAVRNAGGVGRSWRWLSADVSMRYVSAPSHHVGRGFIWRARKYETSQLHRFKHAPDRSVNTSSCRRIAAGQRTAASARSGHTAICTRRHHTNSRAYCWGLDF
jgi:exodeoxyribonuclease V alpha subunit